MQREALLYEKLAGNLIHCFLCAHHCRIKEGFSGFCGVRRNIGGVLYTNAFGRCVAANVDPVEKKPLYHYLPGSFSYSVATIGCNFRCGFCQNWEISQKTSDPPRSGREFPPEKIVSEALKNNCESISYTYTEPTIFFEYALETAKMAKERGLYNIFVTNGYMTKEALLMIAPFLDAANVDLKFFKNESYRRVCSGTLQPVLETIRLMKELKIWIEITTLIVPGENDSKDELKAISGFIASIDKGIPWHISRFHPDYKYLDRERTPEGSLREALKSGRESGLDFIYIGNISGQGGETFCPGCAKLLIKRDIFQILEFNIKNGICPSCGKIIPGFFHEN